MKTGAGPTADDRVLVYTRVVSLCIVPFLVAGFVILYLFPQHTARLWAWPLHPTMTAMVLASAYLGGAYFFVRAALERRWHVLSPGFLSVTPHPGPPGTDRLKPHPASAAIRRSVACGCRFGVA
jgi:hypothetical protein